MQITNLVGLDTSSRFAHRRWLRRDYRVVTPEVQELVLKPSRAGDVEVAIAIEVDATTA